MKSPSPRLPRGRSPAGRARGRRCGAGSGTQSSRARRDAVEVEDRRPTGSGWRVRRRARRPAGRRPSRCARWAPARREPISRAVATPRYRCRRSRGRASPPAWSAAAGAPRARAARAPARDLRRAGHGAARRPARRARPDRALAVDERPQPRRRLPAPARPASRPGRRCATRPSRRSRRRSGPAASRRSSRRRIQAILRRARTTRSTSRGCATRRSPRRSAYLVALPGRRAQDGGVRAAVRLRPARRAGRHARRARRHAARRCCGRGRGSDEQHDAMPALTPRGAELELHVNMLRHGRRTCHAQRPACAACALRRMCPEPRRRDGAPVADDVARARRARPRCARRGPPRVARGRDQPASGPPDGAA